LQITLNFGGNVSRGVTNLPQAFADLIAGVPNIRRCRCGAHGTLRALEAESSGIIIQPPGSSIDTPKGHSSPYSGNFTSSEGTKWLKMTRPTIDSGAARKAPKGPHIQVQNASANSTSSGLSVRRRPTIVGVMK